MRQDELLLNNAIKALQSDEPNAAELTASAHRLAEMLGMETTSHTAVNAIDSCGDVQHLFPAYRDGSLSQSSRLLIDAHTHECSICRRELVGGSKSTVLDWSAPKAARTHALRPAWRPRQVGWGLATAAAFLIGGMFVYRAYWQVPPGVRAEVQSIDGTAYRISDSGDRLLSPGDKLAEGEHVRTSGGAHATLRLSDGSTVEVNERSVLGIGARGRDMTVSLNDGDMIVQAAKRTAGHLYVKTADCRVAVTGTVFSVDAGIKGSRVAVIEGSVHVAHAGVDTLVHAGDQMTTNENLSPAPVAQQISWSHNRGQYLPVLAQLSILQHRIEAIPFPQARYSSDLLERVPANTLLYVSIPNLGDFLSQANQIFHDQLKQSPALQQWWNHGHSENTAELDALVDKIHQASQYLGDEIVVVGVKQADSPGFAIVADVKQPGLDDFLKTQLPVSGSSSPLMVLDESALDALKPSAKHGDHGYALVRKDRVVFSNNTATLKLVNAQLNLSSSGFADGDFGKQIKLAYGRGAGIILAADIHQMIASRVGPMNEINHASESMKDSGIDGARYMIAEHREINGQPENHIALQFSGSRQGVASWLAAPAPIGSLQFVSPNASIAIAGLTKDPRTIADDIIAMAMAKNADSEQELSDIEAKLQINFRDDLAATLGGDFLVALDGPVLPTPAWKAVIEVKDSDRLEQTLEKLAAAISNQPQVKQHSISITSSTVDGQQYYAIQDSKAGSVVVNYTFANGYMVAASTRALVMDALRIDATGDSLAHSSAFKALLPKNADENYSAIAYQNLTPVLTPLLSQLSGPMADTLRQLAADAKPTVICATGNDDSIEAASDSHLFSLDFLALESLINLGNKHPAVSVRD